MQTLCAYGVEEIYYEEEYKASDAKEVAAIYGVKLEQVASFPKAGF
jgi:dCMP deaminase